METINDLLYWCSHFWQPLSQRWSPIVENQVPLLLHTLMTNVPLTMFLSFSTLICSCLMLRSMTVGNWGCLNAPEATGSTGRHVQDRPDGPVGNLAFMAAPGTEMSSALLVVLDAQRGPT